MKTRVFLIFAFSFNLIFSQGIGIWKNYTDMKVVNKSFRNGDEIWSATEGGLFKFNSATEEYEFFTKSEGLSSQVLTAIDYSGNNIWIGANDGMINIYNIETNQFDRIVDIFTSDKSKKQINDIVINGNRVYLSSDFGISIISESSFAFEETVTKFGTFPSDTKVNSVSIINKIYVATEQGIAVQKDGAVNLSFPDSWETFNSSDFGASNINKIIDHQGELFAASDNGLFVFRNNNWSSDSFDGQIVKDIYSSDADIYVALTNSLVQYNPSNSQSNILFENNSLELNQIFSIEGSNISVSTSQGLMFYSNSQNLITPPGPELNRFISVTVDNDGNLWSASGTNELVGGFYKFDGADWTNYTTTNYSDLPTNAYHKIYAADDNSIYIANFGRGITKLKDGNFDVFNAFNTDLEGISNDPDFVVINDMAEDSQGNIWFVNFWSTNAKPLSLLTQENEVLNFSVNSPRIDSDDNINLLAIDRFDNKWFAVTQGATGLFYFNENGTFDVTSDDNSGRITTSLGLNSNTITAIAVDQRSDIWVGTNEGVNIINVLNEVDFRVNSTSAIPIRQQTINCITVDPINQKWVGTTEGVFVMSSDGFEIIEQYTSTNSPLPSNDIKSIAFDENKGIAYIGTDFGLSSVTTSSVKPQSSFTDLFVYPNPLNLSNGQNTELVIDGLVKNSSVKILTTSGVLVRDIESFEGRIAIWDGRNNNGDLVSTGIYIIVAFDEDATNVSKSKVAVFNQ